MTCQKLIIIMNRGLVSWHSLYHGNILKADVAEVLILTDGEVSEVWHFKQHILTYWHMFCGFIGSLTLESHTSCESHIKELHHHDILYSDHISSVEYFKSYSPLECYVIIHSCLSSHVVNAVQFYLILYCICFQG